jgi:outer membrane protein, heavy metal efflux system
MTFDRFLIKGDAVSIRIIALVFSMVLTTAEAQTQSSIPPDLRTAVERAFERAAAARTLEGKRQEASANRAQANSLLAGPASLGLSNREGRWASNPGQRETEVSLSAPIQLPGQQTARGAWADAQTAEADAAIDALKLALAGEVRERVWAQVTLDAESRLATQRAEAAATLEADVARRVKAGDLARADALLTRQEALTALAALREADARRTEGAARLRLLIGSAALPARYDEAIQPARDIQQHPRIAAARLARERAEKRLRAETLANRQPPEVGVAYRWDRAGEGAPTDRSIGLSVRIPLPSATQQQPLVAIAQTEAMTAAGEERVAIDAVQSDIQTARDLLTYTESLTSLSEERFNAARERASLIKKAFDLGEQSLAEWLRAQAAQRDAEAALARDHAALGLARARLNQAQGLLP